MGTAPKPVETQAPVHVEEREWIERARAGDAQAFRLIVEQYGDRAYGLAFRMLGSAPEAEEVAQDAFVRAWRALPGFRGESTFSTWLHRIVVRRALDRASALKTRRAREMPLEDVAAGSVEALAPHDRAGSTDLSRRLDRLLGSLSDVQRAVLLLYYYEDRSVEEIAHALGMPGGTVKTHLHRARGLLRERWMAEE